MSERTKWYPEYDQIKIIVFTENANEKQKYFNLFHFMLKDKVEKLINYSGRAEFTTNKFHFKFFTKQLIARGHKAHYVINLTQDVEFNNIIAPITIINDYLKHDERWLELFEGIMVKD